MNVATYLFFNRRCEEALEFYARCFGAETLFLLRYKDGALHLIPPDGGELIFHATVRIGETVLNMSDSLDECGSAFSGFALLVHLDSAALARAAFEGLQVGGQVQMELGETPWAAIYGIVEDKFGITWKLQVNAAEASTT